LTHKLLLADDSVTIQRVIELTFADEDVTVVTVGDGQAAIDRLEADPPDIVLADVDMPKRDGYDVAAYVRSHPKLAHIPVVLLTGAFEPIDHARAAAAGSSDVLAKPFEPQMVINRVKQLLGRKRDEGMQAPPVQNFAPEAPPQAPLAAQGLKAPSAPRPPARSSMAMNDEHASLQNQPARPAPGQVAAQEPVSIDDYFDQLDAAFSSLQQPASPAAQHEAKQSAQDWIDDLPQNGQPAAVDPLISVPLEPEIMRPEPPAAQPRPVPPPVLAQPAPEPLKASPPAPVSAPSPAELPADHAAVQLPAPTAQAAAPVAAPVITDEVIEEVVARVLKRLSDRLVRETVTDIVSQTAERVVRGAVTEIVPEAADRAVRETVTKLVPETANRVVRETVTKIVSETADRVVREAVTETVSETVDRVVREAVTKIVPETANRVVRETVTEIVPQTAERLVQAEIERIKAEAQ
jgi:CheY-like chemotaxis protein